MSQSEDPSPIAALLGELSACAADAAASDPALAARLNAIATGLNDALPGESGVLAAIMDASRDAIVSADEHGRIVFFNGGATAMFGWPAAEVLGRSLQVLMPERYRAAHEAGMARLNATGDGRLIGRIAELEGLRKDGSEFPIELSLGTTMIGDRRSFTGVIRDVSARKAVEYALAERAEDLERSNAELEQFAYIASHDLSEPLRMITSYLQLLARRYEGRLDDDADDFIHFAVDGAARMRELIDDLLAYSRVGRNDRQPVRVDVGELVDRVSGTLTAGREGPAARIRHGELPAVIGDPQQLGQLFQNLLGNALKFVPPDRTPEIDVSAEAAGQDGWVFTVADNGIGIDADQAERIFRMFQRLHNREEYPGTGVGLAIARKVVEGHGGRIWAEPRPEGGAAFRFELPGSDR